MEGQLIGSILTVILLIAGGYFAFRWLSKEELKEELNKKLWQSFDKAAADIRNKEKNGTTKRK